MSTRSELGQCVADLIKSKGGVVVSIVPPRAHEQVTFETRTPELGESIASGLRDAGYRVNPLGTTTRIVHDAVVEFVPLTEWSSGPKRRVDGAGLAQLHTYEVVLPALSPATIPGESLPRPVRGPPIRRRRR